MDNNDLLHPSNVNAWAMFQVAQMMMRIYLAYKEDDEKYLQIPAPRLREPSDDYKRRVNAAMRRLTGRFTGEK